MRNLLLHLAYNGSRYHGYQVQQNAVSVAGTFQPVLEKILAEKVQLKGCSRTDTGVHANDFAVSFKTNCRIPFEQDQVWVYYKYPIDAEALNAAAQGFIGTYDYQAFCSPGGSVEDTVRTIYEFTVRRDGEMVEFSVTGSGFLYNMVRIMVGTLLAAGMGKIPCTPEAIRAIVLSKNRARAGGRVPPCGLYLDKVYYEPIEGQQS